MDVQSQVMKLIEEASEAGNANDALKYSQAALNTAQAQAVMRQSTREG